MDLYLGNSFEKISWCSQNSLEKYFVQGKKSFMDSSSKGPAKKGELIPLYLLQFHYDLFLAAKHPAGVDSLQ